MHIIIIIATTLIPAAQALVEHKERTKRARALEEYEASTVEALERKLARARAKEAEEYRLEDRFQRELDKIKNRPEPRVREKERR